MSEIIESGILHMALGDNFGAMFTDMVRQVAWYECNRDRAIVMLVGSMMDMRVDHAESIIDGKMKLEVIDNGEKCEMVEDNWEPPAKEIAQKKREIEDILAYIQLPGYEVEKSIKPIGGGWFDYLPEKEQLRLHEFGRTIVRLIKANIWEAYQDAMFLKEAAFQAMKENSKELGESMLRGRALRDNRFDFFGDLKKEAMSNIATSDMSEETKRRLIRVVDGQDDAMQGKVKIKQDKEFKFDSGWLSTKGVYYGCKLGQHIYLADLLQERFYPKQSNQDSQRCLEDYDWVKCTDKKWWYVGDSLLTPEQMKTIKLWAKKYGEPIIWNKKKMMIAEITRHVGKFGMVSLK